MWHEHSALVVCPSYCQRSNVMVCPCTNLFLSNILAFLSLILESGHLLPKEQESEHSHHSIESMRGTKVLNLRRNDQSCETIWGETIKVVKRSEEKRLKMAKETWSAHPWLQPGRQQNKKAQPLMHKQTIKQHTRRTNAQTGKTRKLTPGWTLAALKRAHSSLCISASLHSALCYQMF